MIENFPIAMSWVAVYEGGKVDDPDDPGGRTNRGVTQRTYNAFRKSRGLAYRDVYLMDDSEHDAIYRLQYWNAVRGDDLPSGVDAAVFDFAVNSGPARAAKYLQRIVGASVDGQIGLHTLAAVKKYVELYGAESLIIKLCSDRMAFLRGLRHFSKFGRGWTRRVMGEHEGVQGDDIGIVDRASLLAAGRAVYQPTRPAPGKAEDSDMDFIARIVDAIRAFLETFRKRRTS